MDEAKGRHPSAYSSNKGDDEEEEDASSLMLDKSKFSMMFFLYVSPRDTIFGNKHVYPYLYRKEKGRSAKRKQR